MAATDDDGKKEFSVLAVGDYDYYANLTFEDANYFDDYLQDTVAARTICPQSVHVPCPSILLINPDRDRSRTGLLATS